MGTNTTKLGLYKPGGAPELVNRTTNLNNNFDRLDYIAGAIHVSDGATPSDDQLFDGAIVREITSGKVWVARTNGLGGFTKTWVCYPWSLQAAATSTMANGNFEVGFSAHQGGKNSSASDLVSGRINVPVRGAYNIVAKGNWSLNGTGRRTISIVSDASGSDDEYSYVTQDASTVSEVNLPSSRIGVNLAANTKISVRMGQSSGVNIAVSRYIQIALVFPY